MFYGFKKSTDLRNPDVEVKKFTSKKALVNWMSYDSGHFTYNDPDLIKNHHHSFKYGYEYKGKIDKKDAIFKDRGTSTYPTSNNQQLYYYINKYGTELHT